MRIKFVASVVAALSLAFIPTAAQAVATTLDIQDNGAAAVDLVSGDVLDVTVAGPIAKTGAAVHELYSTWSAQSLGLDVADVDLASDDITWPEGWDLEYTEDGSTWVNWIDTPPTDLGAVIAIRSLGDVNTVGENMFKTTSDGVLRAASFSGSGGGDGYNVAIGNNKVFNMYHHQGGTATVECHTFLGDLCETPTVEVDGYSTNHSSSVYSDDASGKVYAFVMRDSDLHFGALCFDFSVEPAVGCGFTELEGVGADSTLSPAWNIKQDLGSSSQDGDLIWTITGKGGELLCFNIATGYPCIGYTNYSTGASDWAFNTGRVTAVGGKVFFTLGNKFGCYDPVTNGLCGGQAAQLLSNNEVVHPPIPVEDTTGTLLGACDFTTYACIALDGTTFTMDNEMVSFFAANADLSGLANQNASQFAYVDNRIYYITQDQPIGGDWQGNPPVDISLESWTFYGVDCYDFETKLACAGFDGEDRDGVTRVYTISSDTEIENCVWVNGDAGSIVPLNATTGEVGCDLGNPVVELPYDAVTPRMSCAEDGRVTAWSSLKVNVPVGVALADVRVSFFDSVDPDNVDDTSTAVDSWVNLTPDASGVIDLSGLTTAETGTQPTIRIDAGDVSEELAQGISGTVTFVAEAPELCFALTAEDHCVTHIGTPSLGDIADGIVSGTSITRPAAGNDVGSAQTTTLPGQNADQMCAASALEIDLPISALASTGVDAGTIALGGFAVLAVGGAAIAVTRRRKG